MFLGDFHIHSNFSDGKLSIPELVDLYGTQGFGAIAITDHLCETGTIIGKAAVLLERTLTEATFPIYQEILKSEAERAWKQYRMVLIPGFELTRNSLSNHRSAHILGLGVDQFMPAEGDSAELAKQIRAMGGISIAAHPVSTKKVEKQTYHLWDRREELAECFDAWEVASGPYIFEQVMESKLPKIASSDLHSPKQMTSWKTVLHCERHPEAILEAIRKQRVDFQFYEEPREAHVALA
jgi:hypothetical protein